MLCICLFLFSKYGKDDKLYPKDVTTRAVVDQRLYFDMGTFYKAVGDVMVIISLINFCYQIKYLPICNLQYTIYFSILKCLPKKHQLRTNMTR